MPKPFCVRCGGLTACWCVDDNGQREHPPIRPVAPQETPTTAPPKFAPHTCGHCGMTRKTLNGAWLRWKRERARVGLRELSRRVGLSAAFLSDCERGNRHATIRVELAYQNLRGDA